MAGLYFQSSESDNSLYNSGNKNQNSTPVSSLQHLCRSAILSAVTLERVNTVGKLPLPNLLKDYLCLFHIPKDFDLDGLYIDYHCNFPNHVHHKFHQIHPGKCLIDGSRVLIKSQHLFKSCSTCESAGKCTMESEGTREKWLQISHPNLMNCHLAMVDPGAQKVCFIFEFPSITLQDFIFRMFLAKQRVPEIIVWKILSKLLSVMLHLSDNALVPWDLCHPQNVILTNQGEVKLENLLLYLPSGTGARYQTNTSAYQSPEQMKCYRPSTKTLVWGVGYILFDLTAQFPSSFLKPQFGTPFPTVTPNPYYSTELNKTIYECLRPNPRSRPTLASMNLRTERYLELLEANNDRVSILDILTTLDRLPLSGGFLR